MSRRCKIVVYGIIAAVCVGLAAALIKLLFFSGLFIPQIKLNDSQTLQVEVNTDFQDPGATARFRFHDYSDNIVVESSLDTAKLGTYKIRYTFEIYDKSVVRTVEVVDTTAPTIKLNGQNPMRVFEKESFKDPGFQASDQYDGDLTKQVKVDASALDMNKQGTYEITYTVNDTSGNTATIKRSVEVCKDPTDEKLYYNHDQFDNKAEEWWFHKSENNNRTTGCREESLLAKYDAYMMGPDDKTIYLTFDEGGNDITYIKEIAGVLNDNDVQATFFLTRNYIKDNPEFINDLVAHGHVIGNHSWHHYDMPTLANEKDIDRFVSEITECEKTYMQVTGQPMKKVFRFPKGGMSERSLKLVQDLGYSNYFWSHAYYDYAEDVSGEQALNTLLKHYHNGAIYLLHPSNKGNYLAMDPFIKAMKQKGYRFATVDKIPKETSEK